MKINQIEVIIKCPMTRNQRELYQQVMITLEKLTNQSKWEAVDFGKVITALRKICNHPKLILPQLDVFSTSGKFQIVKSLLVEIIRKESNKDLLLPPEGRNKKKLKVIIFVHDPDTLYVLKEFLTAFDFRCYYIDRSISRPSFFQLLNDYFILIVLVSGSLNISGFLPDVHKHGHELNVIFFDSSFIIDHDRDFILPLQSSLPLSSQMFLFRLVTVNTFEDEIIYFNHKSHVFSVNSSLYLFIANCLSIPPDISSGFFLTYSHPTFIETQIEQVTSSMLDWDRYPMIDCFIKPPPSSSARNTTNNTSTPTRSPISNSSIHSIPFPIIVPMYWQYLLHATTCVDDISINMLRNFINSTTHIPYLINKDVRSDSGNKNSNTNNNNPPPPVEDFELLLDTPIIQDYQAPQRQTI